MRVLLVNNHCITDPTAGVTQSLRTLMEWLADAGHHCRILTTSRFESAVPFTIVDHLRARRVLNDGALIHDVSGRVPIDLLMTMHHDELRPHRRESEQYIRRAIDLLAVFEPDVLIACNGHPMIRTVLAGAKHRGVRTLFALRGYGYTAAHLTDVDAAFTCSLFLSAHYRAIGIESTPLAPPILWNDVLVRPPTYPVFSDAFGGPEHDSGPTQCVTFVHPALHKGLMVFLRLADMLHTRRPDIPLLVVESSQNMAGFGLQPWVHRVGPVSKPADWLVNTKLLLVPSVWEEPFGRVAAEAMMNGIPALVSDRGGLPDVVGDVGYVRSLPPWLKADTLRVPSEEDIAPWATTIETLWDDADLYQQASANSRRRAEACYIEAVSRPAHVGFIERLL